MENRLTPGTYADDGSKPLRTVTLTVGTAGHIDHGKTSLVKYLTGCDTDRLPEEKARGMTIDLGFATCVLPNERRVGIIDVPGHERFVHNMVAGATAIDVVMLVVAADDGVMPQTVEHFHIVRLLGVTSGLVAITKIDMVAPERVEEVREQVRLLTEGSFLADAPMIPVSSKTGEGYDRFYDAFVATVDRTAQRDASGPFRLHVERSFVMKGRGTIVSGIPRSGLVHTGDVLELLPAGVETRIRGIQVYGQGADEGRAGECMALHVDGLSAADVGRGMVLASPGHFFPSRFVSARFHFLAQSGRPLKARTAVRLHVGTSDMPGYMVLPDMTPLPAGGESYVQLQLREPVVVAPHDFLVVRQLSPVVTLGGGYAIAAEHQKMRRTRGNWVDRCKEHEEAFRNPETAVAYVLEHATAGGLRIGEVARLAILSAEACRLELDSLVRKGTAVPLPGERYAHIRRMEEACEEILSAMNRMHDAQPLCMAFERKDLFRLLTLDRVACEKALEILKAQSRLAESGKGFWIPERAARLTPGQAKLAERLVDVYTKAGFASPRRNELPVFLGAPAFILDPVVSHLMQKGELVALPEEIVLHRTWVERSRELLLERFRIDGFITPASVRDATGASRKYVIPLLEYWDAQGLTRRVGDKRELRR